MSGDYPFSGNIIEAYYSNPELDTVAIIWSDNDKAREYYVNVDERDHQFQALLKEFSYESIDECTRNRNEAGRQAFRDAFQRYASERNMFGYGSDSDGYEQEEDLNLGILNILFEFDPEDNNHKEWLFKLKLKMFDQDEVKNSKKKTAKTEIRKATHPLLAIASYTKFLNLT